MATDDADRLASSGGATGEFERARKNNVETFTRMWLSLGADVIKAAGSSHQEEIAEALGIAASRWSQLLELEAQIPREEANLAAMERGRQADPSDEWAPKELLDRKDTAQRDRIANDRAAIKTLKEGAKRGRREHESFTAKRRDIENGITRE